MFSQGKHSAKGLRRSGPPPPPGAGTRRAALRVRRKRQRRRLALVVTAVVLMLAAAIAVVLATTGDDEPERRPAPGAQPGAPAADGLVTLLFGTRDDRAVWLTLVSYDRSESGAGVVYVPAHTAVEVPGRGLLGVGDAYASGGPRLLTVGVETMLGVPVDRYLSLSEDDARALWGPVGTLTVDVPGDVRVAAGEDRTRLVFAEGLQRLSGDALVRLLYTQGTESDDAELGGRHMAFWGALFDAFDGRPGVLAGVVRSAGAALSDSDASVEELAALFRSVAAVDATDRTITTLPVRQVSVGGSELYATNEDEIAEFVAEVPGMTQSGRDGLRVQLLNGNGAPGVGQEVAERLVGRGFRIVLSGNADRLDYATTRIITYDRSERGRMTAQRVRDLLGLGKVQISGQQQGIVDLTIIVGKDWLRRR